MNENEERALANYIQGFTSGYSVICQNCNYAFPLDKTVFVGCFGWILYNNGLVMEYPINLS